MEYISIRGSIKIAENINQIDLFNYLLFIEFEDDGEITIEIKDSYLTIEAEGLVCAAMANRILATLDYIRNFVAVNSYIDVVKGLWDMSIVLRYPVENNQVIPIQLAMAG